MELQPVDLRRVKQALEEAVQEADIAVQASLPNLEEVEKIRRAFEQSLGQVAKMIEPSVPVPTCQRNPRDN